MRSYAFRLINTLGQCKMFWYLVEICHGLSFQCLYLVLTSSEIELNNPALLEFIISSWFYVQYHLPMVLGWFVFQRFPLKQIQIKMACIFPMFFFLNTVVDERLPSDEIRFNSIIDEIRRRRLPEITFQPESLFEWENFFFECTSR